MEPVLAAGDKVLIDNSRTAPSPPGIFVLHDGLGLVAKQVEYVPNTDPPKLVIKSANDRYQDYERPVDEVTISGRVIWFARRLELARRSGHDVIAGTRPGQGDRKNTRSNSNPHSASPTT